MFKVILKIFGLMVMVVLISVACNGQVVRGSGNIITESRAVRNFDHVDISASGELTIIQSGKESLTVEVDDNIMPFITTEVRGRTLFLDIDTRGQVSSITHTRVSYTLNVISIQSISVSGSAEIVTEELNTDRLEIDIGGSGEMRVDRLIADELDIAIGGSGDMRVERLTADELNLDIGGSAEIELAGEVSKQGADIGGSAEYFAKDLHSETIELTIDGVAKATVWAAEKLDAVVSGPAEVRYYGNPQTNFSVSSSGEIHSLGEK